MTKRTGWRAADLLAGADIRDGGRGLRSPETLSTAPDPQTAWLWREAEVEAVHESVTIAVTASEDRAWAAAGPDQRSAGRSAPVAITAVLDAFNSMDPLLLDSAAEVARILRPRP